MLNSVTAVASPPSVTSCMARTPGKARASRASGTTLKWSRSRRQEASSESLMPRSRRREWASTARRAVPSTATRLVSRIRSPGSSERLSRRSDRCSTPAAKPTMTGRVTASVISVCPPQSVSPSCATLAARSDRRYSACEGVVSGGKRTPAKNQRGSAPHVTKSLMLTRTA